jgi:hypothetical protein
MENYLLVLLVKSLVRFMNALVGETNLPEARNAGNHHLWQYISRLKYSDKPFSYMASLESRVEKLERKLAAMDGRRGSVSMLESQYEPQTAIGQTEGT